MRMLRCIFLLLWFLLWMLAVITSGIHGANRASSSAALFMEQVVGIALCGLIWTLDLWSGGHCQPAKEVLWDMRFRSSTIRLCDKRSCSLQSLGNLQENRKRMIDSFFLIQFCCSCFIHVAGSKCFSCSVSRSTKDIHRAGHGLCVRCGTRNVRSYAHPIEERRLDCGTRRQRKILRFWTVCEAVTSFAPSALMNVSCAEPRFLDVQNNTYLTAALEHSRKFASSHMSTLTHPYLDSKELHYWLKRFLPHIDFRILTQHTLPVIVIHTRELILLDRTHQAIAFPDMVIAVVNNPHSGMMVRLEEFLFFGGLMFFIVLWRLRLIGIAILIDHIGWKWIQQMQLEPLFLLFWTDCGGSLRFTKSLLISVLINWTFLTIDNRYDADHNRIAVDFGWAVIPTPATLFSSSVKSEAFFVNDVIQRNLVFQTAWLHFNYLKQLQTAYAMTGTALSKLLTPPQYLELCTRFNLWLFKRKEMEK